LAGANMAPLSAVVLSISKPACTQVPWPPDMIPVPPYLLVFGLPPTSWWRVTRKRRHRNLTDDALDWLAEDWRGSPE